MVTVNALHFCFFVSVTRLNAPDASVVAVAVSSEVDSTAPATGFVYMTGPGGFVKLNENDPYTLPAIRTFSVNFSSGPVGDTQAAVSAARQRADPAATARRGE